MSAMDSGSKSGAAPARDRVAWTPVKRTAPIDTRRSRLVRTLRVALPVAVVVLLGVIVLWPQFRPRQIETAQEERRRSEMVNTRFTGMDRSSRPFTITSDSASQALDGSGVIDMTRPVAEITLANGRWIAVKAAHGRYNQQNGKVDLDGAVELFHDDGYRFLTERAHVDFNEGVVWGDQPVEGFGPKGDIQALGFRVSDKGENTVFTGPSKLTLRVAEHPS
jgi:lipopolysaccharide export system protein LptC